MQTNKSYLVLISLFISVFFFHITALALNQPLQQYKVGDQVNMEGKLLILIADNSDKDKSSTHYFLDDKANSSQPVEIKFDINNKNTVLPQLTSGQTIKIHGKISSENNLNNKVVIVSYSKNNTDNLKIIANKVPSKYTDARNMAAFIVDLTDASASAKYPVATIEKNLIASKTAYQAASHGTVNFNLDANRDGKTDVFGPFKINYSRAVCDPFGWADAANAMAQAAGIDVNLYKNIVYVMPPKAQLTCGWFEVATLGCSECSAKLWTAAADQPGTYFHGLGHNFGMQHSSIDPEDDGVVKYDYADSSDVMGPGPMGFFNGPHTAQTNWLAQYPEAVKTVTSTGIYNLYPMSANPDLIKQPQILKITKSGTPFTYFLSYRQPEGADKSIPLEYTTGVNIHTQSETGDTRTLYVKTLSDGKYYPYTNIRFTQLPRNGDNTHVKVKVDFGICNRVDPSISISPVLAASQLNSTVTYKVSVKNNDMGNCPSNYFRVFRQLPSEVIGAIYPTFFSLAPGGVQAVDFRVAGKVINGDFSVGLNVRDLVTTSPPHSLDVTAYSRLILNTDGKLNMLPGITYKIYDGDWMTMPDFSKLKPTSSGFINDFDISARGNTKYYAYQFDGYIYIEKEGTYRFFTASDDGSKLYINNKLIVNNDGLHQRLERGGYATVSAGWNHIVVEYFQRTGAASLSVYYAGPGFEKRVIPTNLLSYLAN